MEVEEAAGRGWLGVMVRCEWRGESTTVVMRIEFTISLNCVVRGNRKTKPMKVFFIFLLNISKKWDRVYNHAD